jgi:hypothetical protein
MQVASLLVLTVTLGCAASPPPGPADAQTAPSTPAASAAMPTAPTLEKSADSGQVDHVGPSDGAGPDGTNDLGFVTTVEGPLAAIFIVGVDDAGKPTGTFQADTLVGATESPPELGAKPGSGTSGLGVLEATKVLNAKDGSLQAVGPGPHQLQLYVAPSPTITAGTKLRVYVQRPDKSVVAGATITN